MATETETETEYRTLLDQALGVLQMAADCRNIGNPDVGIAAFPLVPKIRAELAKPVGAEPVACMVETESGVMVWPIADYNEASTYCDDGESPSLLYLHPPTPARHDAPETIALKAERDAIRKGE